MIIFLFIMYETDDQLEKQKSKRRNQASIKLFLIGIIIKLFVKNN